MKKEQKKKSNTQPIEIACDSFLFFRLLLLSMSSVYSAQLFCIADLFCCTYTVCVCALSAKVILSRRMSFDMHYRVSETCAATSMCCVRKSI